MLDVQDEVGLLKAPGLHALARTGVWRGMWGYHAGR